MKLLLKDYLIIVFCTIFAIYEIDAQQIQDQNTLSIDAYFNVNTNNNLNNYNKSESNVFQSINTLQYGDYNYIDINSSNKGTQKVNQIGDNNNFEFISFYSSTDINLQTLQIGNNNSIQIFGENSLMKNLLIKQSANNKTLIINNY